MAIRALRHALCAARRRPMRDYFPSRQISDNAATMVQVRRACAESRRYNMRHANSVVCGNIEGRPQSLHNAASAVERGAKRGERRTEMSESAHSVQ